MGNSTTLEDMVQRRRVRRWGWRWIVAVELDFLGHALEAGGNLMSVGLLSQPHATRRRVSIYF